MGLANHFKYHKHKIAFFFASMRSYAYNRKKAPKELNAKGVVTHPQNEYSIDFAQIVNEKFSSYPTCEDQSRPSNF